MACLVKSLKAVNSTVSWPSLSTRATPRSWYFPLPAAVLANTLAAAVFLEVVVWSYRVAYATAGEPQAMASAATARPCWACSRKQCSATAAAAAVPMHATSAAVGCRQTYADWQWLEQTVTSLGNHQREEGEAAVPGTESSGSAPAFGQSAQRPLQLTTTSKQEPSFPSSCCLPVLKHKVTCPSTQSRYTQCASGSLLPAAAVFQ